MARGDEEFVEFAEASSAGLLHAAYLLTGNRHAAEDAALAALVRTYAAWPRVRRDDAFAYARRVLVNYVTDRWRRRGSRSPGSGHHPRHGEEHQFPRARQAAGQRARGERGRRERGRRARWQQERGRFDDWR
jgi:DNA-directed RNA polymerase specialized sigma24 family protein